MARPSNEQYRIWAKADLGKTDEIVISEQAEVDQMEYGAWVAAWIWVPDPDEDESEEDTANGH